MNVRLTLKTPGLIEDTLEEVEGDEMKDAVEEMLRKYVKYGEYVYIDVDTETGKATVVEV